MTMFASKTPRDLNRDPAPVAFWSNYDKVWIRSTYPTALPLPIGWKRDPRPQFDHAQHNEPNPILTGLRSAGAVMPQGPARWLEWFESNMSSGAVPSWIEPPHVDHARRVLSRLARLTEGARA